VAPDAVNPTRERLWAFGVWGTVIAWTAGLAVAQSAPSGISWHFFADGSAALLHDTGLHTYAAYPTLQIGPLALALAGALTTLFPTSALGAAQVVMTAGLPVALAFLARAVPAPARHARVLLGGLVAAPAWTVLSVRWAHLDDALALVLLAVLVWAVATRPGHPVAGGVALAAACAAKPWAVVGFALLLVLPTGRRRALGYAVALTAAAWGPFLVADSSTLAALRPDVGVSDSSVMWLLGYRGDSLPSWDRTVQLVGAPLLAVVAIWRRSWPGALLAGIALRLALDPQDIAYYAAGAVLVALVADLFGHRALVPWLTLSTAVVWWQPFVPDFARRFEAATGVGLWWFEHPSVVAGAHLAWSGAVVLVVLWWLPRRRP
jgi:hypothetical protein